MILKEVYSTFRIWILGFLGAGILRVIGGSLRWRPAGAIDSRILDVREPVVFVFWHDRELLIHKFLTETGRSKVSPGLCAIASRHSDGRIIAAILGRLGFKTVLGSSTKGGFSAIRGLSRLILSEHLDCGIAPDGPKGPRHVMKDGALKIAQLSGAPIVPVAYAAERRWQFGSWDRMFLPKPFSRAVYAAGKPIAIPRELGEDEFRAAVILVEESLREVTARVDAHEYA